MNAISTFRVMRAINEYPEPDFKHTHGYDRWDIDQPENHCYVMFKLHTNNLLELRDTNFPHRIWYIENMDEDRFILALIAAQEGKLSWEISDMLGMQRREDEYDY